MTEAAHSIDVEPILALHRGGDGYVGFVRKPDPDAPPRVDKDGNPFQFENLFSIRADDLRNMLPQIAEWLTHDAYFTVNSAYRAAPYKDKQTGLPGVWRKEKHLRFLTACYADVDSGRPESDDPGAALSWVQALARAELLMESGELPQASIMARSGRGIYLFWLLHDPDHPEGMQSAWPEKRMIYKDCNRALNERLRTKELPADPAAVDAARVLRVPGSIHRKVDRSVRYWIRADEGGAGFAYTLPELAQLLDVPTTDGELPAATRKQARPAQYRKVKNPGAAPSRSNGTKGLNSMRAQDLRTIEQWRGGFLKRGEKYADGFTSIGRRKTLCLYANFLRGSRASHDDARDALRDMASNMIPPYPSDTPDQDPPVETIAKDEYETETRRRWKNVTLCKVLGITSDVARDLELLTIIPDELKRERDAQRPHQHELIQERRDFAREYIEKHGTPTARGLARVYKAAGFKGANHETANQDLNSLGFLTERKRGGRPRKPPSK